MQIDKASILDDTIQDLKELEAQIQEFESCSDLLESEARTGTTFPDMVEHISDNYGSKPRLYKRKACYIDETDMDPDVVAISKNDIPLDMKVHIHEHEVLIEMTCLSREYILLDIIEAINNLNLDAHSVQSEIRDGVLTLTLKSKVYKSICPFLVIFCFCVFMGSETVILHIKFEALTKKSASSDSNSSQLYWLNLPICDSRKNPTA